MNSSSTPSMPSFGAAPAADSPFPVLTAANREAAALNAGFGPAPEGLLFEGFMPMRPATPEAQAVMASLFNLPAPVVGTTPEGLMRELCNFRFVQEEENPTAGLTDTDAELLGSLNPALPMSDEDVVEDDAPEASVVSDRESEVRRTDKKSNRVLNAADAVAMTQPQPLVVALPTPDVAEPEVVQASTDGLQGEGESGRAPAFIASSFTAPARSDRATTVVDVPTQIGSASSARSAVGGQPQSEPVAIAEAPVVAGKIRLPVDSALEPTGLITPLVSSKPVAPDAPTVPVGAAEQGTASPLPVAGKTPTPPIPDATTTSTTSTTTTTTATTTTTEARQPVVGTASAGTAAPVPATDQPTKRGVEFAVAPGNSSATVAARDTAVARRDGVHQAAAPAPADLEGTSPQRTADVAGLLDDATAVALPNQVQGWKKLLLDAYRQTVKSRIEKVGIKDANREAAMPTLLSSPFLNLDSSASIAPVAEAASSFPAEWVEKLAQLTARAERLAPARLEVSLPMEGAKDLRVRVSCRGGQISCEFHNVSSEMQRTFMREWPGLSSLFGRESQLRVEQPTFVNLTDPQQRSGGEQSNRRQRDEQAARHEDADIAAFFSAHRLGKSEARSRK